MKLAAVGALPVKQQCYHVRCVGITYYRQFMYIYVRQRLFSESTLGKRERSGGVLNYGQRNGNYETETYVQYGVFRLLFYAPDYSHYRYYYAQDVGCHAVGAECLYHMALDPDEPCGTPCYGA